MIVNHVRTYSISATSTCRASLKIIDDETIRHIIALEAWPTPDRETLTIFTTRRGSLTSTNRRTTNPVVDTGPAQDLHHHPDPPHTLTFSEPVTIHQSGDPALKFHTRSMIRPDLELHPPSESVPEPGARRGHLIHTRPRIPTRSSANSGFCFPHSAPDPQPTEGRTTIPNLAHVPGRHRISEAAPGTVYDTAPECRTSPNLRSPSRVHIGSRIPPVMHVLFAPCNNGWVSPTCEDLNVQ